MKALRACVVALLPDARSLQEIRERKAGKRGGVADACSIMRDRGDCRRCCQIVYEDEDCLTKKPSAR